MRTRIVMRTLFVIVCGLVVVSSLACSEPEANQPEAQQPEANQPTQAQAAKDQLAEAQVFTNGQVQEAVAVDSSARGRPLTFEVLSDKGHYQYLVVRRAEETGEAEAHAAWADVTVVREGSGVFRYGGHIEGGEETSPGEIRGGRIVGGQERALSAGDVIILPAGVPHQVVLEEGERIVYTVVKVQRP